MKLWEINVYATFLIIYMPQLACKLIPLRLFIESNNGTLDGMGLYSLHEGEGYNFFFLGQPQEAQEFAYDTRMYHIYFYYQYFVKYKLTICNSFLQLSYVHYPFKVKIKKNGELQFTGYKNLYAVKNVNDPHSYSTQKYAVYYYKNKKLVPPDAIEVKITAGPIVNESRVTVPKIH
ncbi:Cell wall protein RHD3 [Candida tropicalis]